MKYYLAYGSNLNLNQMKFRCPTAKVVGIGWIDGYELLFKGSYSGSYLTIEKKEGSRVPVAVWSVQPSDELKLDRYEGYPSFYYKKTIPIQYIGIVSKRKYQVDAFVYIMHEERKLGIPSKAYIETCAEGYSSFGFDIEYLKQALSKSVEVLK